uniref:Sulfhydryl oxidase n=1 Tax=Mastacembelus armatus TaxID=205130 RepID=A0A7N8XXZ5_9TELE
MGDWGCCFGWNAGFREPELPGGRTLKPGGADTRWEEKLCEVDSEVESCCAHTDLLLLLHLLHLLQLQQQKMARRCGRATSRLTEEIQIFPRKSAASAVCLCLCLLFPSAAEAGLYTATDQIVLLTPENVDSVLVNSSAAVFVEFYASWCGHCIAFSPIFKSLARDIKEWKPAVDLAAMDCAAEENRKVCISYGIRGYPSIKVKSHVRGVCAGPCFPRDVQGLRRSIIDKLETHKEPWAPACPPLEPTSQAEIDSFFDTNNVQHLALIFEEAKSYIGREVTLDLLQFENIAVRRVLNTEEGLVARLGVTEFPSCYLYYPGGNFTRLSVKIEARSFYSYALQRLPGVVRSGKPPPVSTPVLTGNSEEPWRPFNRSRVYMADLESALHYSLRVEVAAHTVVKGEALISLKKYVAVLAKYFPGRPVVRNLLKSVDSWLQNQTRDEISYEAFKDILDNSAQSPDAALPEGVRWVGCQGSQPHLRRYPCGVWTLFHVLTVQAKNTRGTDPKEVLMAMRNYVHSFFGCRSCAEHFENMAMESLMEVDTFSSAVLWLWSRHNLVNNRLAGALSEDPNFPKIQWPSPEMCPACHAVKANGDHSWIQKEVLPFVLSYFSSSSILTGAHRLSIHMFLKETKETSEHLGGKTSEPTPWVKPEIKVDRGRWRAHRKPSIVGMRMRDVQEDIVDLDSFVNQHYKAKVLQVASSSRVKPRTLQRKEEQEPDPGLRMLGLQPLDADFELDIGQQRKRLQKRELTGQYTSDEELSHRGRWMSVLSIGFSKVDISLCVVLYFLSSMCLLAMYLFFKNRLRLRRAKLALP